MQGGQVQGGQVQGGQVQGGQVQVVLLGHGSRDPRHAETLEEIAARLRSRNKRVRVRAAYLDHCPPTLTESIADLLPGEDVVVVPMLLTSAFHAQVDVPAALAAATAFRPDLTLRVAGVLGPSLALEVALEVRARSTGMDLDADHTAVLLLAAGSSDDAARAEIAEVAARWLAAPRRGAHAFAAGPGPSVRSALQRLADEGVRHVLVAPYLLAPGFLPDRAFASARSTADALGLDLQVADVLGAADGVLEVVAQRAELASS